MGLLSFIVSLFINLVFSVILSSSIGTLIVRSSRQKLYSTILMTLSTLLIMFPIMMVSFLNGYVKGAGHLDFPLLPYLRGYYDVVAAPLSPEALLNFYLPLILVLILGFWFYKVRMPRYFHEAIYNKKARKTLGKSCYSKSKTGLGSPSFIYFGKLNPHYQYLCGTSVVYDHAGWRCVLFERFRSRLFRAHAFSWNCLWFLFSATNKFSWVATSLEGTNFDFIRSLPINTGDYLRQKFWIFYGLASQCFPLIRRTWFNIPCTSPSGLILKFIIGFLATTYLRRRFLSNVTLNC